jgi:cellulase/cellobiase CelA1
LGERPCVWPSATIAAYVWIKPPGESDGASDTSGVSDPILADPMCSALNGAFPNAPAARNYCVAPAAPPSASEPKPVVQNILPIATK